MAEIQGRQMDGIDKPMAENGSPEIPPAPQVECAQAHSDDRGSNHPSPALVTVREAKKRATSDNRDDPTHARIANELGDARYQITAEHHFFPERRQCPSLSQPRGKRSCITGFAECRKIERLLSDENGEGDDGDLDYDEEEKGGNDCLERRSSPNNRPMQTDVRPSESANPKRL